MLHIVSALSPHRLMALQVQVRIGHEDLKAQQYRKLTNNMRVIMYIEPLSKFSTV